MELYNKRNLQVSDVEHDSIFPDRFLLEAINY